MVNNTDVLTAAADLLSREKWARWSWQRESGLSLTDAVGLAAEALTPEGETIDPWAPIYALAGEIPASWKFDLGYPADELVDLWASQKLHSQEEAVDLLRRAAAVRPAASAVVERAVEKAQNEERRWPSTHGGAFASEHEALDFMIENTSAQTFQARAVECDAEETHPAVEVDPVHRAVWRLRCPKEVGGDEWLVTRSTAAEFAEELGGSLVLQAQGRVENQTPDPCWLWRPSLEEAHALLDEYAGILRLALDPDPRAARAEIARKREVLALADRALQWADGCLVRDLAGDQRGGPARAARALDITPKQVSRLLAADAARREGSHGR